MWSIYVCMTQCGAFMYVEGKKKKSWATWDQAADDILWWIHGNILVLISERVRWCCSMKTDTSESDVWNQIRQNGQQNQHVLALHALLTGVIPNGLTLWKFVFNACFIFCKVFFVCVNWPEFLWFIHEKNFEICVCVWSSWCDPVQLTITNHDWLSGKLLYIPVFVLTGVWQHSSGF